MSNDDGGSRTMQSSNKKSAISGYRYSSMPQMTLPKSVGATPPRSSQLNAPSDLRSRTAHNHHHPPHIVAAVDGETKRDSGIASIATTAESVRAKEPSLPAIVVQDDEPPIERSRSPFGKRKPKDWKARQTKSASPPRMNRNNSFKGIQTPIPAASADDIGLDDLTTDKVTFSTRGSLMFGGKKMKELIASKGDDNAQFRGRTAPIAGDVSAKEYPGDDSPTDAPQTVAEAAAKLEGTHDTDIAQNSEPPRQGLKAGRRKPSMKMLQAAIQGGRVLSAEEVTFSMKVRRMYDHGNESAAEWVNGVQPIDSIVSGKTTPTDTMRDTPTPDAMNGDLHVARRRERPASKRSSRHSGADPRASYYSKEVHELAGGIEDWGDVTGQYIDRYGFIHPDRMVSRSSAGSTREPGRGMQRIATSLRVESDHPRGERRIGRGASSTRSAKSTPPKHSKEWAFRKKGPGSMHSVQSQSSARTHLFRSRTKRVLAEASDMLTLPPGLADIDEDEDAGQTASSLKQREWAREEKWQKMAKIQQRRGEGKGGGMHFEFDTSDPKVVERTWKGIPDRWRATAWHSFLSTSAKKTGITVTDEELIGQFHKLQEMSCADDYQIDVDVPRTINDHIMFRTRYRGGQRLLFRVLHAVSLYFPDTGYVQGMACLATTLLCYFDEEKAFVMMVRMWQLRGLEQLFRNGFEGLMTCLSDFETQWLRGGDVAQKLEELSIPATSYGTRWYLTLFNMSIPFPAQLRVWDVFMLLGDAPSKAPGDFGGADLDVLHATSAAIVDATREILLDSDFENAMKVLTSFVPIKDEDLLMHVARAEWKMKKKRD